jgi:hypothetical protein
MADLRFGDPETLEDLRTYVARARTLDADGAIRLQSHGLALAAYVDVLPGRGLAMAGAVIGLRVMALAEPAEVDAIVSLASVSDRLARVRSSPGTARDTFSVPTATVRAGWAAVAPPRSGWEVVGDVTAEDLRTVATQGIAEITEGVPSGSSAQVVAAMRQRVWDRESRTIPPVPSGAAFAAYALGFLTQELVRVSAHGRWTRLSTATGHVLVR